ncbi:MAG: hypothetical protein LIP23_04025 [Planctomycetes bacterium]|nr:hypothetical protein [Planctomycetota bacterium]
MYSLTSVVKKFGLACIALALCSAVWAGEPDQVRPHMMYFYNPSCRLCTKTNEIVGQAEQKYGSQISHQRFNIADNESGTDNVLYMFALLDEMQVPEEDEITLVVFLGLLDEEDGEVYFTPTRVMVEGDEIISKLDGEISDFLSSEGKGGLTLGETRPAPFFSSHTAYASTPLVPEAEQQSNQNDTPAPVVDRGDSAASVPAPAVRPRIRSRSDGSAVTQTETSRADSRLRFGAISAAALADSVNPCAFATIIILVAMMSSAKRTRREIIAVCLAFTLSVYITYFAIGLFLYQVIAEINKHGGWFLVAADLIYYLAFALCVFFAFFSLRDAYMLFKGRSAEEMVLQLPKAFKKRINVAMAKGVRARWLVVGVFIAGVTVSFLEAACTGQVYLPTIITLAKISFWQSMALLAWYNLLFILPLLIIFALVLVGVTSNQLADFFKKNVAWTKLALGLVFVIMGAVIWFEMYWPPGYRG